MKLAVSVLALSVVLFAGCAEESPTGPTDSQAAPGQSPTLDDLMGRAEVIMSAKILQTDYSRTGGDGPMIGKAKVVNCIKGKFSFGDTVDFAETGWWQPEYKKGETRILFLKRQETPPADAADVHTPWRTAYADSLNFLIDSDGLRELSQARLEKFLRETRELHRSKAKLSATVQEQRKDSFVILACLSSPDKQSIWIHRKTLKVTIYGKKDGHGFRYVLNLSIPGDQEADLLTEIKAGKPLILRFEIKREQVEGMTTVKLLFRNRTLIFPKRCWSGLQSVKVKLPGK